MQVSWWHPDLGRSCPLLARVGHPIPESSSSSVGFPGKARDHWTESSVPRIPFLSLMAWGVLPILPHFSPETQILGKRQIEGSFVGNSRVLLLRGQWRC